MYNPSAESDVPPPIALQKQFDYDGSGNLIYEGWAAPGLATSAAVWAIKQNTYSGANLTAVKWAVGDSAFTNIWDNRAGLSYS